jgi:uncharacterized protein (PEP-CTERM system associated)
MWQRRVEAPAGMVLRLRPLALACLGLCGAVQALAQSASDPQTRLIALEPRLAVQETFTDNHQPGDPQGAADVITRLTAGLGWRGRTGLLRGYLDYTLTGLVYARHSDRNELQNALSANVAADLIEDRLQLLGSAAIARTAISAFGVQPGGAGDNSSNTTETRTLQLAPTLRGPLGRSVRYKASVAHALTSSADLRQGDSTSTTAALHLEPAERARLGWTLDASSLVSDFKLGRRTRSDRLFGGFSADLRQLDLLLSATAGSESTDIASLERRSYTTWGLGLRWTPSPVTRLEVDIEQRFFGSSHQILAEYRLPRTVFVLRSARALSTSGTQLVGQPSSLVGALANDPSYIRQQPDPILREALARQDLLGRGFNPDAVVNIGALRSAATLQDQLELSGLWTGVRQSVMLMASRTTTRRVDAISTAFDDLWQVDRVRSSNLALNVSHRLTPLSTLALQLGTQRSSSGRGDLSSRQTQAELQFQTRLTPDSTASATLRRAHYATGLRSSDETALLASYGVRF